MFILNIYTATFRDMPLEQEVPQALRLWNWFFYFMLGGAVKYFIHSLTNKKAFLFIFVLSLSALLFEQQLLNTIYKTVYCEFFYGTIPCILISLSIFILLKGFRVHSGIVPALSQLFLPVYVLHPFILKYMFRYIFTEQDPYLSILYLIIVVVSSVLLSLVIMRIPYLNKVFKI